MTKRLTNVVPETQQEVYTTIKRDGTELEVEVRACKALDDELRQEFRDIVKTLATDDVALHTRTDHSNQGNETGQDVTLRFNVDNKVEGVNVLHEVVQLGKEFYDRQLERNLAREDRDTSSYRYSKQQKYYDDTDIEEFCLLFRGRVEF